MTLTGRLLATAAAAATLPPACAEPPVRCPGDPESLSRPDDWTVASHCQDAPAGYGRLFGRDAVHRIDLVMSPEDHRRTLDDLEEMGICRLDSPLGLPATPLWVPVTVRFDGRTWSRVGFRYKGFASLKPNYCSMLFKLPFRLNFDRFEDGFPELDDQRFFGFDKLTFSNGHNDPSLLRAKLAAELFEDGGVPVARAAFARVYLDHGEGPTYFGLYTMVEDPVDRMLEDRFGDGSGNLYKPEPTAEPESPDEPLGPGTRWLSFVAAEFDNKTYEDGADWHDVQAAIRALHAPRDDPEAWRSGLEAAFAVDGFLRWLAMNQTMVNWDTYGFLPHNYYLYGDPRQGGRLVWIPWDLNEALLVKTTADLAHCTSVMLDEVGGDWPLIRLLLDDPVYRARYGQELQAALDGAFSEAAVLARLDALHARIAPFVVGEEGESRPHTLLRPGAFDGSLEEGRDALKPHVRARVVAVREVLAATD